MKFSFKKNDESFFELSEESEQDTALENTAAVRKVSHNSLTPDEVLAGFGGNNSAVKNKTAIEMLKKRIENMADQRAPKDSINKTKEKSPAVFEDKEAQETETVKQRKTLLDECSPYIKDENGKNANLNEKPLYKLQSVSEILKSDSEKALERLSKKYDISFDDLGHKPPASETKTPASETKTPAEEIQPVPDKKEPLFEKEEISEPEKEIFEEKIPIKNAQSNVKSIISDIDIPSYIKPDEPQVSQNTATITFTPVNDAKGGKARLKVSSKTRQIDLTGEISELPEKGIEQNEEVQLEKNEFEDYAPEEEFKDQKDAGKFIKKLSIKKKNAFLICSFTVILTLILALTKLPLVNRLVLAYTKPVMIICAAIAGIIVILNGKMFLSLKNIFRLNSVPDICAALCSLTSVIYAVIGITAGSIINDVLLLLAVILTFRSLSAFYKTSYLLSNFKQICTNYKKTAVKLINDNAVTFAMAKNSIEGDVLIAAPQKTEHIDDYIKYSSFGKYLGGKLPVLTAVSLALSVILGLACAYYYEGAVYGFYAAAAIQCFTALPVAFFIDVLPLYTAAKKLNKKGGMIAGITASEYLEMANAVVIDSADLFPYGTITLHQMKVLSENSLDDTIIRAASLTESLNSPLAPIFKQIAGTGNITVLPDSDTVKYEDRMGISGWVDNRLLFIGNRTLMEAHGIEVPSVEIDRKILRRGYFPVYVATGNKACALLIVQYTADSKISGELRRLTKSGVTLLVNSCDPNLIEEMICDYFGLYSDSVKVMSAAGCHIYKSTVSPLKSVSAAASFKNNPFTIISIINCASKIKKSNVLLTTMYILSLVLGVVIFAYTSFGGSGTLISETTLLIYGLLSTVISYIVYLFSRP